MKDEMRFEKGGKVYIAIPAATCKGCVFLPNDVSRVICIGLFKEDIKCSAESRVDGTSVIWKLESEVDRPCVGGASSIRDVLPDVYGRRSWAKRFKELQEDQRAAKLEPVKHFCAKPWKDGE